MMSEMGTLVLKLDGKGLDNTAKCKPLKRCKNSGFKTGEMRIN